MRRLRSATAGARVTLMLLLALLVSALPGAAPRAAAEEGPTAFAPVAERGAATMATAEGGDSAQPQIVLPSHPVAPDLITDAGPGAKPAAPQGPGAATAGGTAAPLAFPAAGGPGTLALSGGCEVLLANPDIDYLSPEGYVYDWYSLQGLVGLEDAEVPNTPFFSYRYALKIGDHDELNDPDDSPPPNGFRDEDWFGQDFVLPADAKSITLQFNVLFANPDGNGGLDPVDQEDFDQSYAEFYLVDEATGRLKDANTNTSINDGNLIQRLDLNVNENIWYRFSLTYDATNYGTNFTSLLGKRVAVVFSSNSDKALPYEQPVFDNIQVTACPTETPPSNTIQGHLTQNGTTTAAIADASLALVYSPDGNPANEELIRVTTADWDAGVPSFQGYYRFSGLPALPTGGYYQVYYLRSGFEYENDDPATLADDRLAYYAGPRVTSFIPKDQYPEPCIDNCANGGDFEIADTSLLGPDMYARASGTITFTWRASPIQRARYLLCFYDPDTYDEVCSVNPTTGTSLTATAAALRAGGLAFDFGDYIGWYVRVLGPTYNRATFTHIGASGYSNFVAFLAEPVAAPPAPPPGGNTPPKDTSTQKAWTLMFYMAGDDEDLSNPPGFARSMQDMVPALIGLADRYKNVNIVVQFDFFESTKAPLPAALRGTQYCYFKPGERNLARLCQQLSEQSMADPATLTGFINRTLTSYPATNTALILIGHGSPVAGVAGDRTGGDDAIDPTELDLALANSNLNEKLGKLDLLVFYNCLMGSYEVATLARPYADYMVASPNITTLIDINPKIVELASTNPTSPKNFATAIVAAYDEAMSGYNKVFASNVSIAMSAFDLSRLSTVTPLVDNLAAALLDNLTRPEVRTARDTVQEYDSSAPILWGFNPGREDALVDLGNLSAKLKAPPEEGGSPNNDVRNAATALNTELARNLFVLAKVAKTGVADLREGGRHTFAQGAASGVSIYFPNGSNAGSQAALTRYYLLFYRQLDLGAGSWDELVEATRTGLPSLPRSIRLTSLSGRLGSTLQNQGSPQLFPPAASMPGASTTYLPFARR